MPDLPVTIEWPHAHGKPLAFIAQINLAEVHPLDFENQLPKTRLVVLYDAVNEHWGDVPEDYWHLRCAICRRGQ